MSRFLEKKKTFREMMGSKIFFIFCLVLIGLIAFSLIKELFRKIEISREIQDLETQINGLEGKNSEMANLIDYLNSSEWQEKEVKSKLNLKAPGEKVILIPENSQTNYNNPLKPEVMGEEPEKQLSNPQKWWNYFLAN